MLVRFLLTPGIQDTQCGFKCFRAEAANDIFSRLTRMGFSFDVESLVIADRLGYRVTEIPVRWHYDSDSRVRLIRDSGAMVLDVITIYFKALRGDYDDPRSNSAHVTMRD
jgi:dolichyl-phosphate beta-glucosyltransferase